MGMKTVSIYSDVDQAAQHVKQSDEAINVGPAPSNESYLVIENVMSAIKSTGAKFVHPGYGFLSENAIFRQACEDNGIAFVGPPVRAIQAMGDKIESKQIAIDAGVNVIPGDQSIIKDADEAVKVSNEVGYPVMIKASAGGGGKGMRIAWNDEEAREGFRLSTDEAKASFDDDRIFIEKFIERPHHIEIQLLADGPEHNNVICFPERECSIQRRNQKVIEEVRGGGRRVRKSERNETRKERLGLTLQPSLRPYPPPPPFPHMQSPSTLLTPETRKEMATQAAMLARAVGYSSAGTVEFLCDEKQNFYFLEMNTRLQVEHPVTEEVSGVDLVKHMLEVAAGHPLPKDLVDACKNSPEGVVPYSGWSMEARVYAEDPFRSFLPSTGPLFSYQEPTTESIGKEGVKVRCDSGVVEGSDISMFYDPMISKLITRADTRLEAIDGLSAALDEYVIRGVSHNTPFCLDLCRNQAFRDGDTPTSFIDDHYPEGFDGVQLEAEEKSAVAIAMAAVANRRRDMLEGVPLAMEKVGYNDYERIENVIVTIGGHSGESFSVVVGDERDEAIVQKINDTNDGMEGEAETVSIGELDYDPNSYVTKFEVGGKERVIQMFGEDAEGLIKIQMGGAMMNIVVRSPDEFNLSTYMKEPPVIDTSRMLLAPMPGKLVSMAVEVGDEVELGQELCVVEAMKMQNVQRSERKGVIKAINVQVGASMKVDEAIIEFE